MNNRKAKFASQRQGIVMMGTSPGSQGGIATVVSNYQDSGLMRKWRVHYIVTHVQRSRWTKARVALAALFELTAMLLLKRVVLVHVHMTSGASTWRKLIYLYTAMFFRVPTFIHIHSGDYFQFYDRHCNLLKKGVISFAFRKAANVIALSNSWLAGIQRIAPNAKTAVVYNAVLVDHETGDGKSGITHEIDAPVILYLGLISASKGVFDLIRSAASVRGDFSLVVAGDGDMEAARNLARELGVERKVQFPGWVSGVQKENLLREARLLVLPSYTEGIPMSILEAMSHSIPIIATPVGGIPETMTDGREGVLVPVGATQELCAAIEKLLGDPALCYRLGSAGRKRITEVYCPAAVYPGLENLWAEAGARPRTEERANETKDALNQASGTAKRANNPCA
jgi:glycosyltransferase involved in cell wall biosynthesis